MNGTSSFLSQSSSRPLLVFILGVLDPHCRDLISYYTGILLNRVNEGNPHRQTRIKFINYGYGSPSHVVGGRDEMTGRPFDDMITEDTLDLAAFRGYESIFRMVDDFQNFNEDSPYLWHIAAGQHDDTFPRSDGLPFSWDPKWQHVRDEIKKRNINLSMILANPCPNLLQLFYATPARMRIQPWFNAYPDHTILLSGFVEVTVPNSSSNSLAHGIQYMPDNLWGPYTSQLAGSDPYAQITETVQNLNLYEDPQASSSTAVHTLPHVSGARGPVPMPWSLPPRGGGAWEQQPMSHDYTGVDNASGDLANVSASPTARLGMSGDGWTGRLHWDGAYIHAWAKAGDAVRNPKLPEWPEVLQLEIVADSNLSTIDIQAWMRKTKCSMAVLRCICETDDCDYDQLVKTLCKNRCYAIVRWENQERLLLAPAGKALHCAAFPDNGIPGRPQRRPLQPLRVTKKDPSDKKPKGPQRKKRSSRGRQSNPVAMPMSPEGSYPVAVQNGLAPSQQQPEQVQVSDPLPRAMGYTPPDGDLDAICPGGQANTLMQHQVARMSPPQLSQTPWYQQSVSPDGAMGVDGEHHGWRANANAASRAAYSSDIDPGAGNANTFESNALSSFGSVSTANSEADIFNKYMNWDGNGK